jgi:hypothetical protein
MRKWRLIIDEPPWIRLFGESDHVVETCLPSSPVSELIDHLIPGDRLDVCADDVPTPNPHQCAGAELWTSRMQLALLSDDMDLYQLITAEVGQCHRCWAAIAHWALGLVAGDRAARAGSNDVAASYVLREIARLTMP